MTDTTMQDPRARPAMPLWGKLALGCALIVVIATATCAGVGYLIFKKGADLIEGFAKDDWAEMRRAVDQMMTDEGAIALYKEHQGLGGRFATQEDFLSAVRGWRPGLEPVPEKIPVFKSDFRMDNQYVRGKQRTIMSYENGRGARVRFTWESRELIDIDVLAQSR